MASALQDQLALQPYPFHDLLTAAGLAAISIPLPRSIVRNVIFIPAIAYFSTRPIILRPLSQSPNRDFSLAMVSLGCLFQVVSFMLSDTEVLRRKTDPPDADSGKINTVGRRLSWVWHAFMNPRWIGWSWEVPSPRPFPPSQLSRAGFLKAQALNIVITMLAVDVCQTYFHTDSWYTHGAWEGIKLIDLPVLVRIRHAMVWVIYAYTLWFLPFSFLCFINVALGIYKPQDCPSICGNFKDAYSLRLFWGRVWHQANRHTFCSLGGRLSQSLLGKNRGPVARYIMLFTAFAVSAAVHSAGSWVLPPDKYGQRGCRGAMLFFLLQFPAVCIEEGVIHGWCRLRNKPVRRAPDMWARILGYVWVVWFGTWALCATGWLDEMVGRRSLVEESSAYSLSRGIWKGQWRVA